MGYFQCNQNHYHGSYDEAKACNVKEQSSKSSRGHDLREKQTEIQQLILAQIQESIMLDLEDKKLAVARLEKEAEIERMRHEEKMAEAELERKKLDNQKLQAELEKQKLDHARSETSRKKTESTTCEIL